MEKNKEKKEELYPNSLLASASYTIYATIKEKLPYSLRKSLKRAYDLLKKNDQTKGVNPKSLASIQRELAKKQKKTRLVIVLNWLAVGGAESMMLTLLSGLKNAYDIIIVATSQKERNEWANQFMQITKKIYILSDIARQEKFFDYFSVIIQSSKPDVVLISNSEKGYDWLKETKKEKRINTIDILHNNSSEGFTNKAADCDSLLYAHVVVGEKIKETLIKRFSINEDKIKVIPNGINTTRFKPITRSKREAVKKKLCVPPRKKIVTFIGRFSGEKRPLRFVRVAHRLLKKRDDLHFLMVGDGHERKIVEWYIDYFKLADDITLCGFQDNIEDYLSISDCLLATSYLEGFFITVLEAIASGVCVVSPDVGEVTKMIQEGMNGCIVKSDKLNDYAEKVEFCLDHLSNKKEEIRNTFDPMFSAESMISSYDKLFSSLVKKT